MGERIEIEPIAITWRPVSAPIEGHLVQAQQGSLVEISFTGARVLARARHSMEIGSWIELDVEGDCAVVAVQRIAEATDSPGVLYSVAFVMLSPTLRARVDHTIATQLATRGLRHGGATPLLPVPN